MNTVLGTNFLLTNMSKSLSHFYETSKKVSVEWKIENFRYQKNCIRSPKFLLSDARFSIQIFPAGEDNNSNWVSLYLLKEHIGPDMRVAYTMGLKSVNGSVLQSFNSKNLFSSINVRFGCRRFIEESQLTENVFGSDGSLTFFCKAYLTDYYTEEVVPETLMLDSVKTLLKDIEQLYASECLCDVTFNVKGKKFSAHRSILSARSSVFRSMFNVGMKERESGEVNITDCDPESFESFLLFLYSGKLNSLSPSNAIGLYTTADKYNVQDLKKACCDRIIEGLCIDSMCDAVHLAALHGEKELLKCATEYFINNASEIIRTVKWEHFVLTNFTLANELLIKLIDGNLQIKQLEF